MRTTICNITNLDATAVRGLQSIVRTNSSAAFVPVVRGVFRSVRHSVALLMRLLADAMAKPAYATLPGVAARQAIEEPTCFLDGTTWQVGLLSRLDSRSGRVDRG